MIGKLEFSVGKRVFSDSNGVTEYLPPPYSPVSCTYTVEACQSINLVITNALQIPYIIKNTDEYIFHICHILDSCLKSGSK